MMNENFNIDTLPITDEIKGHFSEVINLLEKTPAVRA